MKKKNQILTLAFTLLAVSPMLAQEQDLGSQLTAWTQTGKSIVQAIILLASLGGGLYAYFKVQTDDGGNGKKAIGNFALALIFGAVLIAFIEFFLGADIAIIAGPGGN